MLNDSSSPTKHSHFNLEAVGLVYPCLCPGERTNFHSSVKENHTQPGLNHDLPVISSLFYCKSRALDHVAAEACHMEEALLLVKKLNSKYLGYTYSSSKFAGEQGLPVCCSICHQTGHDFHNCKEDSLEAFAYILPPMENHFMSAIITFCHQIEVEWAASEEDITIRQQIVAEMETFIANEMKGAQLNVFGSSCNGFGLRKSDLDICLTFVNNKTGKLERPEQPQHVIDGYETYFFEDLKRLPHIWPGYGENVSTVGELWLQFLKFYVNFDFKSNVVSIRLQEPLSCFEKLWTSKCMAIEDPFELSHNLGAHISKKICVGTFLLTQTFTALVIGDGNEIKRLGILLKRKVYSKTFHSANACSKASLPKLTSCTETEEF
uniref:Polymerase nucleotidyl transferase domain-containing protein n=1 Tax=Timema poppense TaxID=170557 RepID=A0A7R9CIC1_TIMPO|nr:unnamed protein product [Timema poppensis]